MIRRKTSRRSGEGAERSTDKVSPDNPFDLVINEAGELVPVLDGVPYTMDQYRAYYAEKNKKYRCKYNINPEGPEG